MNPYEHAQQPATPEPPSGLPIAGSPPPPAYDPNQGYPPANSYEHAQPVTYGYEQAPQQAAPAYGYEQAQPAGYEQAHQQAAPAYGYEQAQPAGYEQAYQQPAPPTYPQTPEYHQNPGYQQQPSMAYPQTPAYQQQPPTAYPQTPAYQQQPPQPPQMPPGYQQAPPPGPPPGAGWGMPPEAPPAYIITAGAPGTAVKKSGVGKKLALIALVALVVIGGGGAFAADAWAKGQVCDAVQGLDNDSSAKSGSKKGGTDEPTVAELDAAEKGLNSRANLLFFHGDLKEATHDLADDVDTLKTMVAKGKLDNPDAKTITQLLAFAASLDSHARKAQRACGLPEKSLMGTTA